MNDYQRPAAHYLRSGRLFILLLVVALFACQPGVNQSPITENNIISNPLEPADAPGNTQGIVTYLTGDVYLARGQDWEWIDIGALVTINDTIRTGEDGFCEINLRDTATIHIRSNTVVKMINIFTVAGQSKNTLELISGSVLFKINKLIDNDFFHVVSPGVICGVRGTEFLVQAAEANIVVAVKEGKVALLPRDLYTTGTDQMPVDRSLALNKTVIAAFEANAPLVAADEEVGIPDETAQALEAKTLTFIKKEITTLSQSNKQEKNETANLEKQITASASQWQTLIKSKQKLSAVNNQALANLGERPVFTLPDAGEKLKYKKLRFRADVPGAEIYLNDKLAGKTVVAGMFASEQSLTVLVTKDGYEPGKLTINPEQVTDQEYLISLKALPAGMTESEKVLPSDTETGTPANDTKTTQEPGVKEKPLIENQFFVSFAELIGELCIPDKDHVIAADKLGVLTSSDLKGRKLWSMPTNNQPNENSAPVLIGQRVYFAGPTEWLILDATTGKLLAKKTLDTATAPSFGSRIIAWDNRGIYPANDKLVYFDLNTGAFQEELAIPEGLRMTPAVYKDQLLVLSQAGELIFIDAAAGKISKRVPTTAREPIAAAITIKDEKAYFAGRQGPVICFDLAQSKVVWEKAFPAEKRLAISHDLICSDDGVFVFSGQQLFALSAKDGTERYPAITNLSAPPLYQDGLLFISPMNGGLIVYQAKTGLFVKEIKFKERVSTHPVFYNGRIYIGTDTGLVLVINPESLR